MDLCKDLGCFSAGSGHGDVPIVVRSAGFAVGSGGATFTGDQFPIRLLDDSAINHTSDWSDHCCIGAPEHSSSTRLDVGCCITVDDVSGRSTPASTVGLSIVFLRLDFQQHESEHLSQMDHAFGWKRLRL